MLIIGIIKNVISPQQPQQQKARLGVKPKSFVAKELQPAEARVLADGVVRKRDRVNDGGLLDILVEESLRADKELVPAQVPVRLIRVRLP